MKRALALLLLTTGCQSIAGIDDVTLADAGAVDGTSNEVSDTLSETTPGETMPPADTMPGETVGCASSRGPTMVQITHAKGSYCIDSTEVSKEQYDAFRAATKPSLKLPERCTGLTLDYQAVGGDSKIAQHNVTWCEAYVFCAWAGKRLCGAIDSTQPLEPKNSEWMFACSQGNTTKYPYGDTYSATSCVNGAGSGPNAVGSAAECKGAAAPYDALYDMSGNVSEWVDECVGSECHALGGYYGDSDVEALSCTSVVAVDGGTATVALNVKERLQGLGFRCCR